LNSNTFSSTEVAPLAIAQACAVPQAQVNLEPAKHIKLFGIQMLLDELCPKKDFKNYVHPF
jgi:hypothetical protein